MFGPGAHNGADVFLGVGYPSKGLGAQRYVENISPRLTEVKTAINTIGIDDTELTLGNLETSLSGGGTDWTTGAGTYWTKA